jgi:hypothetical protein
MVAVNIKKRVLWDMTSCRFLNRQPPFRISLLPPSTGQKTLKPEAARSYETLASIHQITLRNTKQASVAVTL